MVMIKDKNGFVLIRKSGTSGTSIVAIPICKIVNVSVYLNNEGNEETAIHYEVGNNYKTVYLSWALTEDEISSLLNVEVTLEKRR